MISENSLKTLSAASDSAVESLGPTYTKEAALRKQIAELKTEYRAALDTAVKTFLGTIPGAKALKIGIEIDSEYNDEGGYDTVRRYSFELQDSQQRCIPLEDEEGCELDDLLEDSFSSLLADSFSLEEIEDARGDFWYVISL